MKIHTKIVIDMSTGEVIEDQWHEYFGPVSECKSTASAPASPDPVATADAQSNANIKTLLANLAANSINQVTPYGSMTYSGTPGQPNFTQTQSLAPAQQSQLDQHNQLQSTLGSNANTLASNLPSSPMDFSSVPQIPGAQDLTAFNNQQQNATYTAGMNLMQPQFDQQQRAMQQQLADQGIPAGSEAYNTQMDNLARQQNSATSNLALNAVGAGNTAAQMLQTEGLQNRQQGTAEQQALYNSPYNTIASLMGGTQIQQPTFQSQTGFQAAPTDYLGAQNMAYNGQLNNYNAQVGQNNSTMGALGSLGSAAMMAYFSDRRLKSNIVRIGTHRLGIGIYEYDIFGKHQAGVMADEVEGVLPSAVITLSNGYKAVNYGAL